MERERNAARETEDLGPEGLPGHGFRWTARGATAVYDSDWLLHDPAGKVVYARENAPQAAAAMSRLLGREIGVVHFLEGQWDFERVLEAGRSHPVADKILAPRAFVVVQGRILSIPERAAAAALAWSSDTYFTGPERNGRYILPRPAAGAGGKRLLSVPWKATSEQKAYEVAEMLSRVFNVEAMAFDDGDGYRVAVTPNDEFEIALSMDTIDRVLSVAQSFNLTPNNSNNLTMEAETYPEWRDMSARLSARAVTMVGIRDALDGIREKTDASQLKSAFALDAINGRLDRLEKAREASHA